MPDYDFHTLSPTDFEQLTRDLLQKELGCSIESFKAGADGGIDLRFAKVGDEGAHIVQCKRYVRSTFYKLKSELVKEVEKLQKLQPSRYYLSTALPLSPQQKDQVLNLLEPWCKSTSDILGRDDLNNLLGKYPDVERLHFKLWLCSASVLETILHRDIFNQKALSVEDIERKISLFVATPAMHRVEKALDQCGFCLIVGIPGIGKSTTAEIALASHAANGWETHFVTSASQALQMLNKSQKQIIYYDDFLGQTSLDEKLERNEDVQLIRLLEHCQRSPRKTRFLLTTREYLLEQARDVYEKLSRASTDVGTCTVELEDYSRAIRAQVLVNHLFSYRVKKRTRKYLAKSGIAKQIVNHPNYNPRIIETLVLHSDHAQLKPSEFAKQFLNALNNPEKIWESAFHSQLSAEAQNVLICFATIVQAPQVSNLERAFHSYSQTTETGLQRVNKFRCALRQLFDSFLTDADGKKIEFHTPAVKDFTDRLLRLPDVTNHVLTTAIFYCQVVPHMNNGSIDPDLIRSAVLSTILSKEDRLRGIAKRFIDSFKATAAGRTQAEEYRRKLAGIANDYLESEARHDSTQHLIELCGLLEKVESGKFLPSINTRSELFELSLVNVEDYKTLAEHLRNGGSVGSLTEESVTRLFSEFASETLSCACNEEISSDELEEQITEIQDVARFLGIPDTGIDTIAV